MSAEATATFAPCRGRLFGLAYRMLGSAAEAEDVLQEAQLRWLAADRAAVSSPQAWLTTVVTRLCLDALKSARARRETYVGPWLPEPVATARFDEPADLASISQAFLLLLESLSPLERAVFVLREVFDYSFAEVAETLGRDEAACRQLLHRARAQVQARRPRFARSAEQHGRLLGAFLAAVSQGDVAGLQQILADDVVAWSDGGGRAKAALNVVHGPDKVARLFIGLTKKGGATLAVEPAELNGWPAIIARDGGLVRAALAIETDGEKIFALYLVNNPDKLARAEPPSG